MQIILKNLKKKRILFLTDLYILLISTVFIIFYAFSYNIPQKNFDYDEVDYINAANLGIISNAFERGSLNLKSFVFLGLSKDTNGKDISEDANENFPPEESDPFLLRHFHPPLPVYYWSVFSKLSIFGLDQERLLKISGFVAYFIFCLIFMGVLKANTQNKSINRSQALFLIVFFTSPLLINTSLNLNFHTFHAISCIFFSYALVNYLRSTNHKDAYVLGIAIASLVMTLETSLILIFFGIMIALVYQRSIFFNAQRLLKAIIGMLISILILWPGTLWTGGPIKSFGMHAYRVFIEGGSEYDFSKLVLFKELLFANPLLIFLSLCIYVVMIKKCFQDLTIFVPLSLGLSLLIFIGNFAHFQSYFLPAITLIALGATSALEKRQYEK